jgi:type I restriction enzyme S subunit
MSEWKEYKISQIAEVIGGGTPSTVIPNYWNGNIPWLTPKDLTGYNKRYISKGERFISEIGLKNSSARLLPTNSVLLSTRAPIGYVAIAECPISTNQGFKSLILNPSLAEPNFIYYWIKDNVEYLNSIGTGTTFAEISGSTVKEISLLLPPLPEQESIAEVLSSLDDKIDLLHRNNKTLEELAETLFRQWFLEEKEEDCKKSILGELVKVIDNRGKTPSFTETKTDYPIIEVNALNGKNRYIDYSLIKKYVDEHTYNNWFRAGHPKLNDILFSTVGSIGEMSMLLNPIGTIAQNIVALRAEKISPYYLYQYLMSIQDEIKEFDIGSVQPSIKVTHLTKIEIPMPDSNKVNLFDNQAKDICNKISINYNQIQRLETLRNTLLPKLMSGVVRVEN